MTKKIFNFLLILFILFLFLFNRKQQISHILENQLCSTKFDNVIVYHGPSNLINKARIILKKGYPLYVLQRKKSWIKVIDPENRVGWIMKSNLLNEKRTLTKNKIILQDEEIILLPKVSLKLISIFDDYCIVEIKDKKIKIKNTDLWIPNFKN